MIGIDTNLLFYARVAGSPYHRQAVGFLESLADNTEVVISELVLAELYLLLRNPAVLDPPLEAAPAVAEIHGFRCHPHWQLQDAVAVMAKVWPAAAQPSFPRRRLFDVRLACTLQAGGVDEFATANLKDFADLGFKRVWNPLIEG
jgi:toxin-antitoxin system PIN domain toxin